MSTTNAKSPETSYRRLYTGLWILSGIALGVFIAIGYPLVGVGLFAACAASSIVVVRQYDGPLFDERDWTVQAAASKRTLGIMGMASAIGFPTVTALWALDIIEWPLWLTPIAFFVAALSLLHLGNTMYEARQYA
ncbi:DUF2178 domain-containing protein [Halogeometricum borinquense]|uniref:DUF2178 domain-containing protein n=1 Tax=Halogeometricum borinquense TaxID=60847 RepID=A0A6C0UKS7_9EURY|nr:DUF2178 domain-containing protein [Halogeometricum borinquense]QIB74449.1 DUF2178 domain-containing protein [Halogeometricum borinquense]